MDQDLITRKTIKYVMASSVLQKRALDALAVHEKAAAEADAIRGRVLAHLCKVGGFGPAERADAERHLAKQAGTLEILDLALAQIEDLTAGQRREKAASLGGPDGTPPGGLDGGGRDGLSAADRALMRVLDPPAR